MNITVPSTIPTNWKEIAENPILGAVITDTLKNGEEIKFEIAHVGAYGAAAAVVCYNCLPEEEQMNEEWTNAGGWNATKMRRHLRENILPLLPDELRAVIVPRVIMQNIKGEIVTPGDGADDIWLPSATEMFGDDVHPSATKYDHEDIHFDLYSTEKSRVKECGNHGTWPYWLRSPLASSDANFTYVYANGTAVNWDAAGSIGVAFGFLIDP